MNETVIGVYSHNRNRRSPFDCLTSTFIMATTSSADTTLEVSNESLQGEKSVDVLASELEKAEIRTKEDTQAVETKNADTRLRITYSRTQLLNLSQSPLVKPPDDMPNFKAWLGFVVRSLV